MIGVYGANGFIGRHLISRLKDRKAGFKAVSRHFSAEIKESLQGYAEVLEADLADPLAMASSLQDVDTVVQLVSTSSPGMQNRYSVADIEANVIPHVAFMQNCVAAGVKRYIFISSGGTVYGPAARIPIREDQDTTPISSHGLTKLMVEKYLQMHGYVDGLEFVILRLSNPFGPGQQFRKAQGLIPAILKRHAEGLPVRILGSGESRRDYVFIDDVIDALELALAKPDAARQIINIGSGESRSVMEVVQAVEETMGITLEKEFVESRKTDVDVNVLDITKARELLGWKPDTPFRTALERTLACFPTG